MLSTQLNDIYRYCDLMTGEESLELKNLERQTHLQTTAPQMLSGKLQGRLLSFISKIARPRFILDIGTFTGYSAICLAEGLSEQSELYSIDITTDYDHIRESAASESSAQSNIHWIKGDALIEIPKLNIIWDLVFLDASKNNYLKFLDLLEPRVRPGGILIADNVLWYGKVLREDKDEETSVLHQFNERLKNSELWTSLLLPVRDGLSISIKN